MTAVGARSDTGSVNGQVGEMLGLLRQTQLLPTVDR